MAPVAAVLPFGAAEEFSPFGKRSVVIRPARPDDLIAVGSMLARLSPASSRLRFFSPAGPPRARLVRPLVEVDHEQRETLVALCGEMVIGMAEYVRPRAAARDTAEVAVVVEDAYQRRGVAAALFRSLARMAHRRGIVAFTAVVLPDNRAAVALCRALSPGIALAWSDGELQMRVPLLRS